MINRENGEKMHRDILITVANTRIREESDRSVIIATAFSTNLLLTEKTRKK